MIEIKLKSQLSKIFSVKEHDSDFLLELLTEKIQKKIKESETIKIDSVGYFKKEGNELIFSPFQFKEGEPLFLTLKTEKPNADIYSFDEDIFSVGGDANITPALSIASGKLNLEEVGSLIDGIIETSEIIENYDLIGNAIEISANQQNNEEIPTEIDTWQEELKSELLSDDLFGDFEEESEEQPENNEPIEELDLDNDFDFDKMKKDLASEESSGDNLPFDNFESFGKEEGFEQIKSDTVDQGKLDSSFVDIEDAQPTKQETEKPKEKEKEKKSEKKEADKKGKIKEQSTDGKSIKKKGKLLIIIIIILILLGGGGAAFYFFFWDSFFGEHKTEKLDEHNAENAKDSAKAPITPFTKKELGEAGSDSIKTHDIHSDSLNIKVDEEYNQIDPRMMKEFKDDKKITNSIYLTEGKYMVQISSWKSSETATQIVEKLYQRGFEAFVVKAYLPQLDGYWYRVRIGYFKTQKEAENFLVEKPYKYVR